ncbi:5-amino-6-(D-ribitylamino)uracil--L-tyrosine 4-hydroxyphenyl transferase CofH [Candidatus Hecatella orcuttiae]|uniref:5-amino-6-(D-ribitylamino)uracil--L-tyrosine 4-hydroxyphenyl transferase CofH n=1 Tax=Candidatus Hecatella orcuttiae TaxID=1935119 RepID=UPI0028682E6C|nr:5-amino-6-(D-ribitylamino)uracil--L-tyrosine 4-hydroxyphenyl transferase CofH [Candidatus Hecatella orcuttiae]
MEARPRLRELQAFKENFLASLDSGTAEVLNKALGGGELTEEEASCLLQARGLELHALILAADWVRRRRVGDIVTYVVNWNINFTNICGTGCRFCAFSRSPRDPEAYLLSPAQVAAKAEEAWRQGATEVCIQGGLHPEVDLGFYEALLRAVKRTVPSIHIHAFSPMEVVYAASKGGLGLEETLRRLKEAGLDSMPGTAAEVLVDEVRRVVCPEKISVGKWVQVVETAHRLGIPTTATIMYGHVESPIHQARHLAVVREVQKKTRGFTEFIPLTFIPWKTALFREGDSKAGATGAEDLRMYAVSRLMLAGWVDNIQVSWVKLGPKLAQVALNAGANDLGGTLMEENISRAAGASSGQCLLPEEMERMIRDLGRIPAQRTTTYQLVTGWRPPS